MKENSQKKIHLSFSDKYDRSHSEQYFQKHQDGLARRMSHMRDVQLARKALRLAGEPQKVLDLPCGAGRFWSMLLENGSRELIGADNSADMVAVARANAPESLLPRIQTLQTSAFAIDLPDHSVDSIFCMRLMHHIEKSEHRLAMLREFGRVTRDTVILSLWVDGNFKAWKRARLERRRPKAGTGNRFVIPAKQIEKEFGEAGFRILGHYDFLPRYAMWRVYVLRLNSRN
jgi:ubiquinone/menaquinone biosynthesis C-methylase UbiE